MADFPDAGDWRDEDAAWERLQRDVLSAFRDNDQALARRRCGQALALAKEHFRSGDPRLAASLACQGRLLREKTPSLAADLFREARAHWAQAPAWLASQQPPGRPERLARSSSFHLRLESKHPGAYQARRRTDIKPLLALGLKLSLRLRDADGGPLAIEDAGDQTAPAPPTNIHRKTKTAIDLLNGCLG